MVHMDETWAGGVRGFVLTESKTNTKLGTYGHF
jgi:hypothetical protein